MPSDVSTLILALWRWEITGYASVAAVAIGVAGESLHEFTGWFKRFSWWEVKGGRASALLLIAALAAELITQVKANGISGQIIATLNEQAEAARERSAGLEKQVEALRAENLSLQAQIAPRNLSPAQQSEMANALSKFRGRKLSLITYPTDAESFRLAVQITNALKNAHIEYEPRSTIPIGSLLRGVKVSGPPSAQDFVDEIAVTLRLHGIEVAPLDGEAPAEGAPVELQIGVKPFPL